MIRWRWKEGQRSTSSPTESSPHSNRQGRPPAAKTSCFGAAATSFSSTWQRDCWDELELHVVPVLLGDGARIFDNPGNAEVQLEQVRAVEAPGVTHLKYRVVT